MKETLQHFETLNKKQTNLGRGEVLARSGLIRKRNLKEVAFGKEALERTIKGFPAAPGVIEG